MRLLDSLTSHASQRMDQRAVSAVGIRLAMRQGMQIEQHGATVFFLGRRHLPPGLPPAIAARLAGTVVVVARDGAILTTFRCQRVPRRMRYRSRCGPRETP
jgi:hypothetical protein